MSGDCSGPKGKEKTPRSAESHGRRNPKNLGGSCALEKIRECHLKIRIHAINFASSIGAGLNVFPITFWLLAFSHPLSTAA